MWETLKKYLIIAAILGLIYFILANHFVFFGKSVSLLPKNELTLSHTFVSVGGPKDFKYKGPEAFLGVPELREAGIGPLLVEKGYMTGEQLDKIIEEIDSQERYVE